ncbi:MAG: mammalian cell entry protein, partial [Candidatus Methylophosphatis roskildensis]
YVALDFFHDAKKASFDPTRQPPELPTQAGSLEELQKTLTSIAAKLDKLPLDGIARDLRSTLQSLDRTLKDADALVKRFDNDIAPEARAAIGDLRKTMDEARATLQQAGGALAGDAPLQQNAREALREVTRAAQALRTLADTLERHPESLLRGKQKEESP